MSKRQILLLAVLVASLGSLGWKQLPDAVTGGKPIDDWLKGVGGLVSILSGLGLATENQSRTQKRVVPFRLTGSFRGGLFGGLIGGAIAGLISGVAYQVKYRPERGLQGVLEICLYGAVVGAAIGGACLFLIMVCRHLLGHRESFALYFLEVAGGLVGGVIGGTAVGIVGGWNFYDRPNPPIDTWMILLGASIAPLVVAGGALLYDYGGRLRHVLSTLASSAVVTLILATITALALRRFGVGEGDWWSTIGATKCGAILGSGIGAMMGLQIGITLLLNRLQDVPAAPETRRTKGRRPQRHRA